MPDTFIQEFHHMLCSQSHPTVQFVRIAEQIMRGHHWGILVCNATDPTVLKRWSELCPHFTATNAHAMKKGMQLYGFTPLAQQLSDDLLAPMVSVPSASRRPGRRSAKRARMARQIEDSWLYFHPTFNPETTDFTPFMVIPKLISIIRDHKLQLWRQGLWIQQMRDISWLYDQGTLAITPPDGSCDAVPLDNSDMPSIGFPT